MLLEDEDEPCLGVGVLVALLAGLGVLFARATPVLICHIHSPWSFEVQYWPRRPNHMGADRLLFMNIVGLLPKKSPAEAGLSTSTPSRSGHNWTDAA